MTTTHRRPTRLWTARATRAGAPVYDGPLLLDTHLWLWYLEDASARWARPLTAVLDACAAHGHLRVSDISVWEIAQKAATGKLQLALPLDIWFDRAAQAAGVRFLPLDRATLRLAPQLGDAAAPLHKDPVDRMLIAAAQIHDMPLATCDAAIIDYAAAHGGTPCFDARP